MRTWNWSLMPLLMALLQLTLAGCEWTASADDVASPGQSADEAADPPSTPDADASATATESTSFGLDTLAPYPLNQVVDIDMQDVPISDVAKWIRDEFDVPVEIIDEDDEWQDQARFNVRGEQQRLYTILQRALQSELTGEWYIQCSARDEQVVFSEESNRHLYRVVNYDVADLLDRGFELKTLKDFLQKFTSGEWADLDGIGGEIEHIRGVLIVRQSERVHEEIAYLLAVLRRPREPVVRLFDLEDNRQCRLRLEVPVTLSLDVVPFDQAISHLGKMIGVPMRIHAPSLQDNGYETDVPVSLEADGMIAADAIDALLASHYDDLDGHDVLETLIEDGEIVIRIEDGCFDRLESRMYDVPYFTQTPEMQAAFIKLLMTYTSGEWLDIDGLGGEIFVIESGWIVIRQTAYVFDEIDELLPLWREAGLTDPARDRFPAPDAAEDPSKAPNTAAYVMHVDTATDLLEVLPERVSSGTWQDDHHLDAVGKIRMVRLGMVDFTPRSEVESADVTDSVAEVVATDDVEVPPVQFPAAILIIEHQNDVLSQVEAELGRISPESWTTIHGEIRPHTPIEPVYGFDGGGYGGGFGGYDHGGDSDHIGNGGFQGRGFF